MRLPALDARADATLETPRRGSRDADANAPLSRRTLCKICAEALGLSMHDVAAQCKISYNHLVLVLDDKRRGSARVEAALDALIRAAKPLLLDALGQCE